MTRRPCTNGYPYDDCVCQYIESDALHGDYRLQSKLAQERAAQHASEVEVTDAELLAVVRRVLDDIAFIEYDDDPPCRATIDGTAYVSREDLDAFREAFGTGSDQ